jgi:hypothetical protein
LIFTKNLAEMPLPGGKRSRPTDMFLADVRGKQQSAPVPPRLNSFVADLDSAFMKKDLYIPQREWKSNVEHDCQKDDLR